MKQFVFWARWKHHIRAEGLGSAGVGEPSVLGWVPEQRCVGRHEVEGNPGRGGGREVS